MTECIICGRKSEERILYENDEFTIMLAVEPSTNGHLQIFPKQHYTILEQVPEDVLGKMMNAANKMSILLFELLKVHGTNIIISNGVPAGQRIPHFGIDILPRRTDDNLKLDWTLKPAAPESLESVQRIIEEGMSTPEQPVIEERKEEKLSPDPIIAAEEKEEKRRDRDRKTNYYHQLFERIP